MSAHTFHVPVMGIGFTLDSPIRLAPLGIDSAISLVSDSVIETARALHSKKRLLPYVAIEDGAPDARARRITEYLDLVDKLVAQDIEKLRASSFEDEKGISRYFNLLPETSALRQQFLTTEKMEPGSDKEAARDQLRQQIRRGTIDVNIMTKVDSSKDAKGQPRGKHNSVAQEALRGFALSTVEGAMIFSAGANPGLFAYLADFDDFFPDKDQKTKKRLILKVSDFRSAHVQGRMLARRGLWVSEYRIESGLNCGGHAFPTEGLLMGPILKEFADRRDELEGGLFKAYQKGLVKRGLPEPEEAPPVKITAQGGVGTHREHEFLMDEYNLDGIGWGSPFLMVPEAVSLDSRTFENLAKATPEEISLSWSSPLGVRFWWLTSCGSEEKRVERIEEGFPGSVCTDRHLALNEEYGNVPLCTGSRAYQKRKKAELDPNAPDYDIVMKRLESPACICVDLCGSFLSHANENDAPPAAICPGPNIVNFQKEITLEEMVDHIYGRTDIITRSDRPHLFAREIELYFQVFEEDLGLLGTSLAGRTPVQLTNTLKNLETGFDYYEQLFSRLPESERSELESSLRTLREQRDSWDLRLAERLSKIEREAS